MEQRNIDFEVSLTRAQWDQLGRTAAALPDFGVLQWRSDQPETIEVCARNEDAPAGFQDIVSSRNRYGGGQHPIAEFIFNDGRPYASLQPPPGFERPVVTEQQGQRLERELQRWVRNKWHQLVNEAGVEVGS
jgi:hypothetical protein